MTTSSLTERAAIHVPSLAGQLAKGWRWHRLDEVCEGIFDCPHSTPVLTDAGPYVVRTQDILSQRFRGDLAAHVSEDTYQDRIRRAEPRFGDLLFSREGTYFGIAAEVPRGTRVCLGQRMVLLRPVPATTDPRFLKYWLNSPILASHVEGLRDGTVAERLNMPTIRALPVPLAPLSYQKQIGQILGSLDDKIDLNRRTNETLEAMSRALFKSWFVDFDPVHAKAAIRREYPNWSNAKVSRAALPTLPSEIGELVSDSFEDSTVGSIPNGWRVASVPDVIEVNPSRPLRKGETAPYLEMSNMPTRLPRASAWDDRPFGAGTKFLNGDTLVARITPCLENGKTAYVDFLQDGQVGAGSTEYIILRPKPPLPTTFAYYLARNEDFRQHLITNMTGTSGRQRAPADSLNSYRIVVPPDDLARHFGEFTANVLAQMKANDEESRELTTARDSLLPQLLSGELQVEIPCQ